MQQDIHEDDVLPEVCLPQPRTAAPGCVSLFSAPPGPTPVKQKRSSRAIPNVENYRRGFSMF